MRKFILILCLLLSFSFVYADDLVDEYIDQIENNTFTKEDLENFKSLYNQEDLELFLTAHIALLAYDYARAYESLEVAYELTSNDSLKVEILY
jgi:hypothetical protein